MLKKIVGIIVVIIVLFILSVFNAPDLANALAKLLHIPNAPTKIIEYKEKFDTLMTQMPSQGEIEQKYHTAKSGAIEMKGKIVEGIHTTKETVDTVRETLSGAEQKIDDAIELYNDAKDFVDTASEKIDQTKQIIEDTNRVINNVKNTQK